MTKEVRFILIAAVCLAYGVFGGCTGQNQGEPALQTAESPGEAVRERDAVPPGGQGLEVNWWVTSADERRLLRAFSGFAERPVDCGPAVRELWSGNGLRLVAIPREHAPELKEQLPSIGANQRQWLGEALTWSELFRGPASSSPRVVVLHDGLLDLDAGAFRMLVRAWVVPIPAGTDEGGARAELRVELMPQYLDRWSRAGGPTDLQLTPPTVKPEERGQSFERMRLGFHARPGEVYALLSLNPDLTWLSEAELARAVEAEHDAPAPDAVEARPFEVGSVMRTRPETAPARPVETPESSMKRRPEPGPPSEPLATLGETLMASGNARGTRVSRAVLLLIPHIPERYETGLEGPSVR